MNIIFQGGSHQIFLGNSIIILINQAYESAGLLEFNKLERKIAERLGNFAVTPCVGVWIEIWQGDAPGDVNSVTPCVGVWIEMSIKMSLCIVPIVTPCVGVWIEILACFVVLWVLE